MVYVGGLTGGPYLGDPPATLLTLTAAGKRKLAAARKKRHKVIEDLLKDWSPAQVKTFATQVSRFNKLAG